MDDQDGAGRDGVWGGVDPGDPLAWVRPENARWAAEVPGVAEFLERLPGMLVEVADALGATSMEPVLDGWGGAVVRAETADGTVAVKLPHLAVLAGLEAEGARRLARSDVGPRAVAQGQGWYATSWVQAPALGPLLVRTRLDTVRGAELLCRLGDVDVRGLEDVRAKLARRCEVVPGRRALLGEVGLDVERVVGRTEELRRELSGVGRWGFCHGDLHPGNVLVADGGWLALDCIPRQGPRESDVGWLAVTAACGEPSRGDLAELCAQGGLDPELAHAWALAFAAECLTSLLAEFPTRRAEIDGLARFADQL